MKQQLGILVGGVGVFLPALLRWSSPGVASTSVLLEIAVTSGALGGALLVQRRDGILAYVVAIVAGALAAACAFGLLSWWLGHRSSLYSAEAVLVLTLGAAPAALLGQYAYERVRRPDVDAVTTSASPRSRAAP